MFKYSLIRTLSSRIVRAFVALDEITYRITQAYPCVEDSAIGHHVQVSFIEII